jgi:hypothetical protein
MHALTYKLMALALLASLSTGCGAGSDLLLNAANTGNETLSTKNTKESSTPAKLTAAQAPVSHPCLTVPAVAATQALPPNADFSTAATDDTPVASTAASRVISGQAIAPCRGVVSATGEGVTMRPTMATHVTCGSFAYAVPALTSDENASPEAGVTSARAIHMTPALVAARATPAGDATYIPATPANISVQCGEGGILVGMASTTAAEDESHATTRPSSTTTVHCGTATAVAAIPAQRLESTPTLSYAAIHTGEAQPTVYAYPAVAGTAYSTAPAYGYTSAVMPVYPTIACGGGEAVASVPAQPAD